MEQDQPCQLQGTARRLVPRRATDELYRQGDQICAEGTGEDLTLRCDHSSACAPCFSLFIAAQVVEQTVRRPLAARIVPRQQVFEQLREERPHLKALQSLDVLG